MWSVFFFFSFSFFFQYTVHESFKPLETPVQPKVKTTKTTSKSWMKYLSVSGTPEVTASLRHTSYDPQTLQSQFKEVAIFWCVCVCVHAVTILTSRGRHLKHYRKVSFCATALCGDPNFQQSTIKIHTQCIQ